MSDTNADIRRIQVLTKAEADATIKTKQIAFINETDNEKMLYKKSSGDNMLFPAEGNNATFKSVTDTDLSGTGNRNVGTDENGQLIILNGSGGAVDYQDFIPQEPLPDDLEGRLFYNANEHTMQVHTDNADYDVALGETEFARGKNQTGVTIPKGFVVDFHGITDDLAGLQIHVADSLSIANTDKHGWYLAVATEDILDGEYGTCSRLGAIHKMNTAHLSVGTPAYLDGNGSITNTRPNYPAQAVLIGTCIYSHLTDGIFQTAVITDNYEYEFDGCLVEKHETNIVVVGTQVFLDVSNLGHPTRDLPVQLSGSTYQLDTTTGSGVNGAARIELIQGTPTLPQYQLVYIDITSTVPTLKTTAGYPTTPFALVSMISIRDYQSVIDHNADSDRRLTSSKAHNGRGRTSYFTEKFAVQSPTWFSGVTPTATIDTGPTPDTMDLSVIAGIVYQTHRQTMPSLSVLTDGIYLANGPGGAGLENYTKHNDLVDLMGYTDIDTGQDTTCRGNLVVFGVVNKSTNECKLYANLPNDLYGTNANQEDNCYYDLNNTAIYVVPNELRFTAFLIARIPFYRQGDVINFSSPTGTNDIINLLGTPIGISGGASGTGSFTPNLTQVLVEGNDAGNIDIINTHIVRGDVNDSYVAHDVNLGLVSPNGNVQATSHPDKMVMLNGNHVTVGNPPSPTGKLDVHVDTSVVGDITVTGTEDGTGPNGIGNADGVYTYTGATIGDMSNVYQRGTDSVYIGQVSAIWIITNDVLPGLWTDSEYAINSLQPIGTWQPTDGSGNVNTPTSSATSASANGIHTNGDACIDGFVDAGRTVIIGDDQTTRTVAPQELITKKYVDVGLVPYDGADKTVDLNTQNLYGVNEIKIGANQKPIGTNGDEIILLDQPINPLALTAIVTKAQLNQSVDDLVPYTGADKTVDLNGQDLVGVGDITTNSVNVDQGIGAESYKLTERGIALGFPVPTIRPTQANKTIALDIMPNGVVSDFSGNGVAWLDIVDTDAKGINPPMCVLRMGIGDTQATVGCISYNGATAKPLNFVYGSSLDIAGSIGIDGVLNWYKDSIFANNVTVDSVSIATLHIDSDVARGTIASFPSDLTYDGGRFQNATRFQNDAGDLILGNPNDDIIFINGALMSADESFRITSTGDLKTPASYIPPLAQSLATKKYVDDNANGLVPYTGADSTVDLNGQDLVNAELFGSDEAVYQGFNISSNFYSARLVGAKWGGSGYVATQTTCKPILSQMSQNGFFVSIGSVIPSSIGDSVSFINIFNISNTGVITALEMTISDINSGDPRTLVSKEWYYEYVNSQQVWYSGDHDADLTLHNSELCSLNTPDGGFWYVTTMFYNGVTITSNRTQTAKGYTTNKDIIQSRTYASGAWTSWVVVSGGSPSLGAVLSANVSNGSGSWLESNLKISPTGGLTLQNKNIGGDMHLVTSGHVYLGHSVAGNDKDVLLSRDITNTSDDLAVASKKYVDDNASGSLTGSVGATARTYNDGATAVFLVSVPGAVVGDTCVLSHSVTYVDTVSTMGSAISMREYAFVDSPNSVTIKITAAGGGVYVNAHTHYVAVL